jgi:hypothetical protein
MLTLLTLLPLDLKIELGKLLYDEKFKRVKEELVLVTRQLYRKYCYGNPSNYVTSVIRPVYVKAFPTFADPTYYKRVELIAESFIWAICKDRSHNIIENDFSVAGSNFKVIKEYLNKNESSR